MSDLIGNHIVCFSTWRLNCLFIVATGGMEDKLSFYFTKFDLGNECGPRETYLTLVDGSGWKYENDKNITGTIPDSSVFYLFIFSPGYIF